MRRGFAGVKWMLALVVTAGLAGCGGSDEAPLPPGTLSPTDAGYRKVVGMLDDWFVSGSKEPKLAGAKTKGKLVSHQIESVTKDDARSKDGHVVWVFKTKLRVDNNVEKKPTYVLDVTEGNTEVREE